MKLLDILWTTAIHSGALVMIVGGIALWVAVRFLRFWRTAK